MFAKEAAPRLQRLGHWVLLAALSAHQNDSRAAVRWLIGRAARYILAGPINNPLLKLIAPIMWGLAVGWITYSMLDYPAITRAFRPRLDLSSASLLAALVVGACSILAGVLGAFVSTLWMQRRALPMVVAKLRSGASAEEIVSTAFRAGMVAEFERLGVRREDWAENVEDLLVQIPRHEAERQPVAQRQAEVPHGISESAIQADGEELQKSENAIPTITFMAIGGFLGAWATATSIEFVAGIANGWTGTSLPSNLGMGSWPPAIGGMIGGALALYWYKSSQDIGERE